MIHVDLSFAILHNWFMRLVCLFWFLFLQAPP